MATPVICEEMKKPVIKHERRVTAIKKVQVVDDTALNKALEQRMKLHAPLWKALAKR